jgi:hypothetical protein
LKRQIHELASVIGFLVSISTLCGCDGDRFTSPVNESPAVKKIQEDGKRAMADYMRSKTESKKARVK